MLRPNTYTSISSLILQKFYAVSKVRLNLTCDRKSNLYWEYDLISSSLRKIM